MLNKNSNPVALPGQPNNNPNVFDNEGTDRTLARRLADDPRVINAAQILIDWLESLETAQPEHAASDADTTARDGDHEQK